MKASEAGKALAKECPRGANAEDHERGVYRHGYFIKTNHSLACVMSEAFWNKSDFTFVPSEAQRQLEHATG